MAYSNYGGGNTYAQNQYGNTSYTGGGYSTTSYGAQGGDQGGGFMGGSQGGSQGNSKSNLDKDTLRPLTIRQVLGAVEPYSGADARVHDVELKHLSIVGQIRNISKQATNITYKLNDGTGVVEVKVWIDAEDDGGMGEDMDGKPNPRGGKPGLEEGLWAKAYGKVKIFGNRTHVSAYKVRPVTDYNEVTYHMLEATYAYLYCTRGPPEQPEDASKAVAAGAMAATGQGGVGGAQQGGNNGMVDLANQSHMPNMSLVAKKVLNTLYNTPQGNEGLHVQFIAQASGLTLPEAMRGAEELTNHSIIFTTVDDNTWALLEN